ncbi:hypothetical protein A3Q56_02517 [Intoshia linei]|uniref:F-box domain-containing protein n=1 Tax=Intoshia linei TaxID=1819745 RepID=A0A177B5Z8_9BILA|nr:hypothetical protein A3Q56_02517 [Intoshia linei]
MSKRDNLKLDSIEFSKILSQFRLNRLQRNMESDENEKLNNKYLDLNKSNQFKLTLTCPDCHVINPVYKLTCENCFKTLNDANLTKSRTFLNLKNYSGKSLLNCTDNNFKKIKQINVSDICIDIFIKICKFLSISDIINFAKISTKFFKYRNCSSLFKSVKIQNNKDVTTLDNIDGIKEINVFVNLNTLYLPRLIKIANELQLKKLKLYGAINSILDKKYFIKEWDNKLLRNLLQNIKSNGICQLAKLSSSLLEISMIGLIRIRSKAMIIFLENHQKLTFLNVSKCVRLRNDIIPCIFKICTNLKCLNVYKCDKIEKNEIAVFKNRIQHIIC